MGKHRLQRAGVALAVSLGVVAAPVAVRRAAAQPPAGGVSHVGLSKDLRARVKIEPIKRYSCKDVVGKATRKMWTAPTKFTLQVASNPGPCDKLPQLFGGTIDVAWTVTVRDEPTPFGTQEGKFAWAAGASKAAGTMSGTWGCGTHRPPLKECERCRAANHVEGLLQGDVTEGPLKGATIRATYAGLFDSAPTPAPGKTPPVSLTGTIQLTLDGVYVVKCP
jgi:hypothetical protein